MSSEIKEAGYPVTKVPLWKNPFALAFLTGIAVLTILPLMQRQVMRAPPPIASLGAWHLVDQDGAPIGDDTLRGQVWIASFFFSRCPSVCPVQQADFHKILEHVADLQDDDKKPIRLVSFSVDPEFDTPAVLKDYARKYAVEPGRWSFVTGDQAALKDLLVKRMMVEVGEKRLLPGTADLFDIGHLERFVLVDQNGDVRGYWGTDELARGNLINAARLLWKRGPQP
ncbi:MAG: SCO family protein [Deltaproteobacteria bacterium]|nr:SCO family protein [Deltaproteobacteria bacterium]